MDSNFLTRLFEIDFIKFLILSSYILQKIELKMEMEYLNFWRS